MRKRTTKSLSPFTDEESTIFLAMQAKQRMRSESILPPTPAQLRAYQSLPDDTLAKSSLKNTT